MTTTPGWARPGFMQSSEPGWVETAITKVTSISLASLSLATSQSERRAGEGSYAITCASVKGWYDAPRDATESIPHWSGDGTVSLLPRLGARTVELAGQISASTPGGAVAAQDVLTRIRSGLLRISDAGLSGSREADVRRSALEFDRIIPERIDWSITLIADDPLRFGSSTMRLTNGVVQVPNRGDATLSPVLDLAGPHGALMIAHPGGTYTFPAMAAGQVRTLDWRNGDVWAGNTRLFGVEGGRRPAVLAGGSQWTVSGLGTGTATLRRYEAWT